MDCGCSGEGADVLLKAKKAVIPWATMMTAQAVAAENTEVSELTRMEFIGSRLGSKTYQRINGTLLQRPYRGGNNAVGRYIDVDPLDVELMQATGEWKVTETPQTGGDNLPAPVEINYEEVGQAVLSTAPEPLSMPEPVAPAQGAVAVNASTNAIKAAEEMGVDLSTLTGTGKDGLITIRDVRSAANN